VKEDICYAPRTGRSGKDLIGHCDVLVVDGSNRVQFEPVCREMAESGIPGFLVMDPSSSA